MEYEITQEQADRASELGEKVPEAFNNERYDEALVLIAHYMTIFRDVKLKC